MYEDMVALALILPLNPTLRLPDSLGTPESLCLQHRTRVLETAEPYWGVRPTDHRFISDISPLFHAASVVLAYSLSSQRAWDIVLRHLSFAAPKIAGFAALPARALTSSLSLLTLPMPTK